MPILHLTPIIAAVAGLFAATGGLVSEGSAGALQPRPIVPGRVSIRIRILIIAAVAGMCAVERIPRAAGAAVQTLRRILIIAAVAATGVLIAAVAVVST